MLLEQLDDEGVGSEDVEEEVDDVIAIPGETRPRVFIFQRFSRSCGTKCRPLS